MTEINFSNTIFHLPFNMMAVIEYIINLQQKGFSQHSHFSQKGLGCFV